MHSRLLRMCADIVRPVFDFLSTTLQVPVLDRCRSLQEAVQVQRQLGNDHLLNMYHLEAKTDGEQIHADGLVEERKPRYKNIVHLWEFLLELLADESCRSLITWSRKAYGEFKLKNQEEVAKRWGSLKNRPRMNYEKLSRALRHYYNQGIIKKVPGQRLVYKFHKLPYEYTPGKTRGIPSRTPPARAIRQDEYCFKEVPSYSDEPERSLTNKERMKNLLQERMMTRNLNKQTNPKQTEEVRAAVSSPTDSPKNPSVLSRPVYAHPARIPTLHPLAFCCCECSLQDVKRLGCPTQILFPVSANIRQNFVSYGLNYGINSVPVPVIKRGRVQPVTSI